MTHALQIFKIYITFEDVEMMLLGFFDISLSFKFPNFPCHPAVQSSRGPWSNISNWIENSQNASECNIILDRQGFLLWSKDLPKPSHALPKEIDKNIFIH